MEDADLQAIRQARLAELRGGGGGGSGSGGPSSSFLDSLGARPQGGRVGGGAGGGSGGGGGPSDEQLAQQEEMMREMLSKILDTDARERLSRIALVKPQKSQAITDLLLRMAQSGQLRQRVTEDQLIGLLDQVDQSQSGANEPKITFTRKKQMVADDDDDFDL
ncbi:DNA-binding TFAR19-related protein [Tilletiaria anomala UBC 951]|uniref:DNA-binding TFAR19-related protein n=1 Tax=Tilletiaria anomala (strain ATCC 24038 / CBS 436.72 / UBC 951) TaxID=1037660 RepID=A0A066VSM0_TILAU|nr:DNA-binding TFAR19-related protein [Tilletiaria anomala UBC 951]KDN44732.1 DNA-binding TFAR19-related protein [Tilletiaria anomala UBC 951]